MNLRWLPHVRGGRGAAWGFLSVKVFTIGSPFHWLTVHLLKNFCWLLIYNQLFNWQHLSNVFRGLSFPT